MDQPEPEKPRPSILVVDDDSEHLQWLKLQLLSAGYRVQTAGDGPEALRVMFDDGPRIVIADWVMPGLTGIELCRMIREHEGIDFAYVLLITGTNTGDSSIEEAFRAGVDDFLVKPLNPTELLARLMAAERICRLHGELEYRTRDICSTNARLSVANEQLAAANQRLRHVAVTDELTGLPNRREIIRRLKQDWKASTRRDIPLACVVIDIDHFKAVNDTHGHPAGDAVLRGVARELQATTRGDESVGRIGGEEFLLVCPNTVSAEASVAAERLRGAIQNLRISTGTSEVQVTISLGVADRTNGIQDAEALLRAADKALYAAKSAGRNAVRISAGQIVSAKPHN